MVMRISQNRSDAAVIGAVLTLCHSLEITVVAEGIENEAQWERLRAEDCERFQGFLFGHPVQPNTEPYS